MRRGIAGHDSAPTRCIGRQAGHAIDNRSTPHLSFFYIPSAGRPKRKPDAAAAECSGMLEIRPWEEAHPTTEAGETNMPVGKHGR